MITLRSSLLLAACLTLGLVSIARADAVAPPPDTCPPGSAPNSSHSGPLCSPTGACTIDSECTMGATCMTVFQCIEARPCGGRVPPDAGPCTVSHVVGACGAGNTCTTGECFTRRVCSVDPVVPSGCACTIHASSRPRGAAVLGLALALLLTRRPSLRRAGRAASRAPTARPASRAACSRPR